MQTITLKKVDYTKKLNLFFNLVLVILIIIGIFYLPEPSKILVKKYLKLSNFELLFLFTGILFIVNIYRQLGNIADYLLYWSKFLKSPKLSLILTSLVLGAMPVKGRTIVSAPVIAQIARKHKLDNFSAAMVDYIATHIYYLFFPLSVSLMFVVSLVNLNYLKFVSYFLPAILFLIGVVIYYSSKSKVTDMITEKTEVKFVGALKMTTPIVLLLIFLAFFGLKKVPYTMITGAVIFIILSLMLLKPSGKQIKKALKSMDVQLIITLALILLLSAITKNLPSIKSWAEIMVNSNFAIPALIILGYVSGITIGSSSTMVSALFPLMAPIIIGLPNVYQIAAITYAAQYAGYIASPAHPCCHYAASYFNNPYLKVWLRITIYAIIASSITILFALWRG